MAGDGPADGAVIDLLTLLADAAAVPAACGMVATALGTAAVARFAAGTPPAARHRPPVSVLRPLCGDEPGLDAALASICRQDYPAFQLILGVQDPCDPALLAVERVRLLYPACDITVVADPASHGPNRKIANLMNMMPAARHDLLVFSDSDLHVAPDYLERIVAALEAPGAGLVTTLCRGLPTTPGPVARLGAMGISHSFLPGALMSRALGREDCLGTTMALRRDTLARAGGLGGLVRHLADDYLLAERVRELGLGVGLAATVPQTAVPERSLRALWLHELRWARTIRTMEPTLYAASVLHYPLFWAAAALALSGGAGWCVWLFAVAWTVRAIGATCTDSLLLKRLANPGAVWLWPLRDVMSVVQVVASYCGARVIWRGHVMEAEGRAEKPLSPA